MLLSESVRATQADSESSAVARSEDDLPSDDAGRAVTPCLLFMKMRETA